MSALTAGSPVARRRFVREVASASALRHPHSVAVHDHGRTPAGRDYLVMERITGRSLAELIRDEAPLPISRAIPIVTQILEALGAGHRLGILHRDIKPSNIMLVAEGPPDFVKVCDFGLAKPAATTETSDDLRSPAPTATTGVGELCGTPEYMAPEQARGEALDGRADLYAVCVLLFELLVGRRPFTGKSPLAIISQHLSSPPPRPRELAPDLEIPATLEDLLIRGLAKDRRERPSSAEGLRSDLLQIARDFRPGAGLRPPRRAVDAPTLPGGSPRRRTARRSALIVFGVAGMGVLTRWLVAGQTPLPGSTPARVAAQVLPGDVNNRVPVADRGQANNPAPVSAAGPAANVSPASAPTPRRKRRATKGGASHTVSAVDANRAPPPTAAGTETPTSAPPPLDPQVLLREAEDLLLRNDVAAACVAGEAAVASGPDLATARSFLGRCYMRMGQPEKGRANYRAYLRMRPDSSDARFVKAIIGSDGKPE